MLREPTARSGKPRRGHEKHCPAARIKATKKTSAGGTKPGPPARTERKWKCSEAPFMGLRGFCRLPCICNSRRLSSCLAAPDGGHVLRPTRGSSSPRRCPRRSRTRPPIRTWIRAAKQIWKLAQQVGHERAHQSELGFEREIQRIERKLSERALTQRKARAREEPSPGPPASETDAGPPGHQPRGGAPARPRLSRGQEGPT